MAATIPAAGPGAGSVDGVRRLARVRQEKGDDLEMSAYQLGRAAGWGDEAWKGRSGRAFVASLTDATAELTAVATGLDHHAATLEAYASALSTIQAQQRTLEARRAMAERSLVSTGSSIDAIAREADQAARADMIGIVVPEEYRAGERSALQRRMDGDRRELDAIERLWTELVEERAAADRLCVSGLQSPVAMGTLPHVTEAMLATGSPEQLLALMGGLSATDLALLLEKHPELIDTAFRADPERVRAWWDELGRRGALVADGLTSEQWALVRGAPAIIGALDGLPPMVRVAANAINAHRRLDEIDRLVGPLQRKRNPADAEVLAALARERAYLEGAVAQPPTVQLYLFDPSKSRIIEMIGEWNHETRTVLTYVPGTLTNMDSFYQRPPIVQQISRWLVANDPGEATVAFVFKDGIFPGGAEGKKDPYSFTKAFAEANNYEFARESSRRLDHFQSVIALDQTPGNDALQTVAIGHSWGLANITSAEVHGARYDRVISLAGAGMPPEWMPQEKTTYTDFSYWDFLQEAQTTGLVWGGNNPNRSEGFESKGYYVSPHDIEIEGSRYTPISALDDNHAIVAQSGAENKKVLEDLMSEIYRDAR